MVAQRQPAYGGTSGKGDRHPEKLPLSAIQKLPNLGLSNRALSSHTIHQKAPKRQINTELCNVSLRESEARPPSEPLAGVGGQRTAQLRSPSGSQSTSKADPKGLLFLKNARAKHVENRPKI